VSITTDPFDSITAYMAANTDPYPFYEHKRTSQPVWHGTVIDHSQTPPPLIPDDEWTLFDYTNVFEGLRNGEVFTSEGYDQTLGLVLGHMLLAMGGKEHHGHRSLVAKAFRQTALNRWEPEVIGPVCDELVDAIKDDGGADLVQSLTFEFPTRVTAALLGLPPEDLETFRTLSLELISISSDIEAGLKASVELHGYFLDQINKRRKSPTDDMIGDLVSAEIDGEKLNDEAIIAFLRLLLPAGIETTYRSAGNLLYLLLTHPEQLAQIVQDRSLIPAAIEEGLRYETPMTVVPRTVTRDVEVGGHTIPAGATVNLCTGSANRDQSRWPDAEKFDIHRPRQPHLSFGQGVHTCLGMHLARVETSAMLNSLLDRVTDLQLHAGDAEIEGLIFRSPSKLPVTFRSVS
jgi:cytochrome P450